MWHLTENVFLWPANVHLVIQVMLTKGRRPHGGVVQTLRSHSYSTVQKMQKSTFLFVRSLSHIKDSYTDCGGISVSRSACLRWHGKSEMTWHIWRHFHFHCLYVTWICLSVKSEELFIYEACVLCLDKKEPKITKKIVVFFN